MENVSTEIPGPKGIDGQWRDAAATVDYFSQTASHDAWAMVAARLGKRANRAAFVQDFWWNRDSGMQNVLRQTAAPRPDWQSAVTSFRCALSRVEDLSAERSVVSYSITRLPVVSRDRTQVDADLESAIALREELETEQQDADRRLREADDRWQMASSAVAAHRPGKPGLFVLLSGHGRTARRTWEVENAELNGRFVAADRERDAASRAAQDVAGRLVAARHEEGNARGARDRLTHELEELRRQVRTARLRWGDHVPDGPEYAETAELERIQRREKSAPWADAEFTAARTELTFFLVVPVVSTTFASLDKLFAGLGRESLGWLFVDEAGQIAYDGLMVFGTPDRPAFRDRNVWCDIRSATSNGHWIPAEGAELRSVLSQLRDAGVPTAQIRVISPFRMVADQAMKVHESVFPEVSGPDRENWVGTVHVMQGKEADVVVLVLGGNPDRPGIQRLGRR